MPHPLPIVAQASPVGAWVSGGTTLPISAQSPVREHARATTLPSTRSLSEFIPDIAFPGSAFQPQNFGSGGIISQHENHDTTVPTPSGAYTLDSKQPPTVLPPSPRLHSTGANTFPTSSTPQSQRPTTDPRPRPILRVGPAATPTLPATEAPPKPKKTGQRRPNVSGPGQLEFQLEIAPAPGPSNAGASSSRKRPNEDAEADTRSSKKRSYTRFSHLNPQVVPYLNKFQAQANPTDDAVANKAGPSSAPAPSPFIPRPPGATYAPQHAYHPPLTSQQVMQMRSAPQSTLNYASQHVYSHGYQQSPQPLPFPRNGMLQILPNSHPTVNPSPPGITFSNLVGPGNRPIAHDPHARYCVLILCGDRLTQLRLSEGHLFYGNEFYDPYTRQQWVLRVMRVWPGTQQGVPSTSVQAPQPAAPMPQYPVAAFYGTQQVSFSQTNVAPMAPSTVPSSHQYSSLAANYYPPVEMSVNTRMHDAIAQPVHEPHEYSYASSATDYMFTEEMVPAEARFMAPAETSYAPFEERPVIAFPQNGTQAAPVPQVNTSGSAEALTPISSQLLQVLLLAEESNTQPGQSNEQVDVGQYVDQVEMP